MTLGSNSLRLAQHAYNTWLVTIPHGTDPDAILAPAYWKHHARTLRPMDVIRCFCEDGSWERWITVIKPEPPAAVYVSMVFDTRHEAAESAEVDDLKVEWKGPALQFCIVRVSTGEPVYKNLYPKARAEEELLRLKSRAA